MSNFESPFMARLFVAGIALLLVATNSGAVAATLDELLEENRALRARLAVMEQQLVGTGAAFHDHDESPHENHDHDHAHQHDDLEADNAALCDGHAEPHFDYCLMFERHHGGHGNCDLCGCSNGIHGHGHPDHAGHAHGPAYHHSIEGYPILHAARTEFFFVERHIHLRLDEVRGADGGVVDELEFEAELVYALNDRFVFIGTIPVVHLNPQSEPSTTGVGDFKFGLRMMAYNGERDGLLFGLDVVTPTGDPDRELGGDTLLLPSANWVHDFGCGTYMFNVVTWEMPIDVDQPEDLFLYDLVVLHSFLNTADFAMFRYLTSSLELNTEVVINGPSAGDTVVDATLGLTWLVGDENELSVGWSFPLSGDRNFDTQLVFNLIRHL